jgi:hypothetical protein
MGRLTCPSCRQRSRLKRTPRYILYSLVPVFLMAMTFTVLFMVITRGHWSAAIYAAGASLIIGLPLDKRCDERYRQLTPIERKSA